MDSHTPDLLPKYFKMMEIRLNNISFVNMGIESFEKVRNNAYQHFCINKLKEWKRKLRRNDIWKAQTI